MHQRKSGDILPLISIRDGLSLQMRSGLFGPGSSRPFLRGEGAAFFYVALRLALVPASMLRAYEPSHQ